MTVDFEAVLVDYLALRRRLGHKLADAERVLGRLVVFLDFVGAETVTLPTALEFILDPDLDPAGTGPSRRLQAVRGFTRYLSGIDPATEIPPAGIVSYRAPRRVPYLFTPEEIITVMTVVADSARTAQRAAMLEPLIGLGRDRHAGRGSPAAHRRRHRSRHCGDHDPGIEVRQVTPSARDRRHPRRRHPMCAGPRCRPSRTVL